MGSVRLGALDLIGRVVDAGSFRRWDTSLPPPFGAHGDPEQRYLDQLAAARERSGSDEAVVTGEARLAGRRIAIVAGEFGFLGGSVGVAAAERLVGAVERATAERLPLLAAPASGGTRMQEGTVAFVQMVKISAAVTAHKLAGLPYLVYLRHPTTGGVFASWGSLGHVTAAEPGALIGFLGPRVYRALNGEDFPSDVQVAENLAAHGLIDAVVEPERFRTVARDVLAVLALPQPAPTRAPARPELKPTLPTGTPAWDSVERSRRADRPGVRELLRVAANTVTPLPGTGEGERDPGMMIALARFGSAPCVVLGQDRHVAHTPTGPGGLREARRGMRLAEQLRLPLVTVIDTAGAALSREAEEGGLAAAIARCLAELTMLPAATVCLLLGQGAGGGALALAPADRVLCAEHAWLSPLPPEGVPAVVDRDAAPAADHAEQLGIRSADLLRHGVVDRIVPEYPDAADEPEEFLRRLGRALEGELADLAGRSPGELVAARVSRYRRIGLPGQRSDPAPAQLAQPPERADEIVDTPGAVV